MANEILVKQDRNAWAVILRGLAEAKGKWGSGSAGDNIVTDSVTGPISLANLNSLLTKMKRLNASYANGTPEAAYSKGITDLFVSPEVVANFRAISFSAFGEPTATDKYEQVGDGIKDEMWRAGGFGNIFGMNIVEMYEFGTGQKYNTLFDTWGTISATQEVLVGIDRSVDAFIRPVARNAETGSTFTALPDDQYATRQDKVGFYGGLEEGRVLLDARAVVGLIKQLV
jgi:hypothetical protein